MTTPALAAAPVLYFSDLTWGPKIGWEGSTRQGAAITVWGQNLGGARGNSFITVNGARLTTDSDYAEWGAASSARGLERVTFWLNAGCGDGEGTIDATVNGVVSNSLPFTVTDGRIYFVSQEGDNSNDGLWSRRRSTGSGPFRDIYKLGFQNNPSGDGQYIVYVRDGLYSAQDPAGDGAGIIYRGPSGGASRRKALVGYPAEAPVIDAAGMTRGVVWNADYAPYGRNSFLTYSKLTIRNGAEAFYVYGDSIRVVGNVFERMLSPVWSGVVYVANSQHTVVYGNLFDHNGALTDGSYKHQVYVICSNLAENVPTQDTDLGWNEFRDAESGSDNRGGVIFFRRASDAAAGATARDLRIHDNYFHGGNQNFIEIGDGERQSDVWIWNNVFSGGPSLNAPVSIRWTTENANVFNNTFYLAGRASVPIVQVEGNAPGSSVHSKNNIFYAAPEQPIFAIDSGNRLDSDHDLFFRAKGATVPSATSVSGPVTADPLLVSPATADFHLDPASPAVNAGTDATRGIVIRDYYGVPRPAGGGFDIGAAEATFEFTLSPAVAIVPAAAQQRFTASVLGGVTWSVSPELGTVSAEGVYQAPERVTEPCTAVITAASVTYPGRTGSAIVTVVPRKSPARAPRVPR